jgi:TRAP-type C4-dicarboxylate transport system permease small subunit
VSASTSEELPKAIRRPESFIQLFEGALDKVGASILGALMTLIVLGVFSRIVRLPILFADELSGYMLVAVTFLAGAEALRRGQFVRVTFVFDRLSAKRRKQVRLATDILTLLFIAVAYFYSWPMIISSYQSGMVSRSVLEIPIYLTQISVVLGLTFVTIRLLLETYKSAMALMGRH